MSTITPWNFKPNQQLIPRISQRPNQKIKPNLEFLLYKFTHVDKKKLKKKVLCGFK